MLACKKCGSETYVKNGMKGDKQRYRCKACGASFTEGDRRRRPHLEKIKSMAVMLYARGAMSFGQIAEFLNRSSTSIYNYILEFGMNLPLPSIDTSVNAVEIDEMHHFIGNKKKKFWIFKALDRDSGKTIAWTTSYSRGVAAVRPLIMKFEQLKDCVFFTDRWRGFRLALAKHKHVIGKDQTVLIERDNSNTRHRLARMKRRTKVVSKKPEMVDLSLRLWRAFEDPELRSMHVKTYLSLYS